MTILRTFAAIAALVASVDASAAPTPIAGCTTITKSGSYQLDRSITSSGGDCIVIKAENVTLDLDGQTILGKFTGSGITDDGLSRTGIIVRNGVVSQFQTGVSINSVAVVEKIYAWHNYGVGILVAAGTVRDNTVFFNDGFGIQAQSALVVGNVVQHNGGGINGFLGGVIRDNVVTANKGRGIVGGMGAVISGNSVMDNGGNGIFAYCPSLVLGNASMRNAPNYDLSVIAGPCTNVNNN